MRVTILTALVFLLCGWLLPARAQQNDQSASTPVSTVLATRAPIAKNADFVGRVDAINRVEIRARVTGYLESVEFKEGDEVKEGDALYRIERDQFKAAVEQARGALERSKATKDLPMKEAKRVR